MQAARLGVGGHPEVVGESTARPCVRAERGGRPTGRQLGAHQHPPQCLVVRIVGERRIGGQLGGERIVGRQRRLGGHAARPGDQRRAPLPLGGHPGALVVRQQRPARQRERGRRGRPGGGAAAVVERLDRLAHARGQLIDVEPVGDEGEAGVGAHDPLDAEHPAQSGHEHAHLLGRPGRQIDVPQRVGERRRRHRRATGDGEHLERGPRLATAERRVGDALDDETTEQADAQRAGGAAVLPELASLAHRPAMLGRRRAAPRRHRRGVSRCRACRAGGGRPRRPCR